MRYATIDVLVSGFKALPYCPSLETCSDLIRKGCTTEKHRKPYKGRGLLEIIPLAPFKGGRIAQIANEQIANVIHIIFFPEKLYSQ